MCVSYSCYIYFLSQFIGLILKYRCYVFFTFLFTIINTWQMFYILCGIVLVIYWPDLAWIMGIMPGFDISIATFTLLLNLLSVYKRSQSIFNFRQEDISFRLDTYFSWQRNNVIFFNTIVHREYFHRTSFDSRLYRKTILYLVIRSSVCRLNMLSI